MTDELDTKLRRILRLRTGTTDVLNNRESTQIEFKKSFSLNSGARYARSMMAFANNRGGYVIFGVEPSPHRLCGVNRGRFEETDPAKVSDFLRSSVSPELEWDMGLIEYHGVPLGYIYAHESNDKPLMSRKSQGKDLKEGEIYYRYKGQSIPIRFSELRRIIDERLLRERAAWMEHLRHISTAGPMNVAVLDTVKGKLYGPGPTVLLEEPLLRRLKFIRQGRFSETAGEPTLRVLGDVQPIGGVVAERPVEVGIHADDLFTAFLGQRQLTPSEASSYLRESVYQTTSFLPIFYFVRLSEAPVEALLEMLSETQSTFRATAQRICSRLRGDESILPIGSTVPPYQGKTGEDVESFLAKFDDQRGAAAQRSFLVAAIENHPDLVRQSVLRLPPTRVAEAVTHLAHESLKTLKDETLSVLLGLYQDRFATLETNEKTFVRKAIAFTDQALFKVR